MISVLFELEYVEFGMLIPVIPLPEKSQKECSLTMGSNVSDSNPEPRSQSLVTTSVSILFLN